ncbi:MAG TPA: 2,3-bisphosphoglycerate-dependent phosphoglycerate mutase [Candidatus Rhabdochlamydia sp.]|jgi:2,3-bisphosphoglycerate-dependent phosphoglycerate mutase|nr:2,3-bisphosphoglycerate-dependent phosphoglycerate mutase [Candidatus Rhabdochlamydia sp.]
MSKKATLIMMRHGQSEWNKHNLFTGWVDIPLSQKGIEEAIEAGKRIAHIPIDYVFTSTLFRAQMTAMISMAYHQSGRVPYFIEPEKNKPEEWSQIHDESVKKKCIPVVKAWQLNERMYGDLQGLNKQKTIEQFGKEQVQKWRRSFDITPPEGESLAMTAGRTIPYFKEYILPILQEGKNVFIAAHGNSLRSIVMYLDHLSKEQVVELELATGEPILYTFVHNTWEKNDISRSP